MFTLAAGSPPLLRNLLKQDEKLHRFTSSLNICHTKAITSLAEYGTKCLEKAINFDSLFIVRSAS